MRLGLATACPLGGAFSNVFRVGPIDWTDRNGSVVETVEEWRSGVVVEEGLAPFLDGVEIEMETWYGWTRWNIELPSPKIKSSNSITRC